MSDHEIRAQVRAGAMDADALGAACGAGTRCGGCRSVIDALVSESAVTISRPSVAA